MLISQGITEWLELHSCTARTDLDHWGRSNTATLRSWKVLWYMV